ncbi:MAG: universal stress protein [Betaproteobacteria bacterium]|nr:universal stress protein [Betaproteobacteria bacterium]
MFRNILVPTDGSAPSRKAIKRAVQLAKEQKARITGFYVGPPWQLPAYSEYVPPDIVSPKEHAAAVKKTAARYLGAVKKAADAARVPCRCSYVVGEHPYVEIVKAARRYGCDVIVIASHGRRGISRLLLGSETSKVLAHASVPVLVVR